METDEDKEGKVIAYIRKSKLARFSGNSNYEDVEFSPLADNPDVTTSGVVNMRLSVTTSTQWNSIMSGGGVVSSSTFGGSKGVQSLPWTIEPRKPSLSDLKKLVIIVNLYMATNVISADDDGLCDPVVFFDHHGSQARSSLFRQSLNPIWNERIPIRTFYTPEYVPSLFIKLYDQDESTFGGKEYEWIGFARLKLDYSKIGVENDVNRIPKYEKIGIKDGNGKISGYLHMSYTMFDISTNDIDLMRLKRIDIMKDNYRVKIHIMGLREMKSSGVFSVKNPFIKFHVGSLKSIDGVKGNSVFDILTARCNKGGPNASFNEMI